MENWFIPHARFVLRGLRHASNLALCAAPIAKQILRGSTVVFLYHEVSDNPSQFNRMFGLNVTPSIFSKQLDLIGEYFHFIDPNQLLHGEYPTPAALVTFDDGDLSYFREALPILRKKRVPSVMFLNMGPIKGEVCWSGLVTFLQHFEVDFCEQKHPREDDFVRFTELEISGYLNSTDRDSLLERVRSFRGAIATGEDIEAVSEEPLVYLGNHLYNHYNAVTLSRERLREEYWKNQRMIDSHRRGTKLFSYPFGQPETCYTRETTRLILEEGARVVFSAYPLPNFTLGGMFYHRVAMTERVRSQADLYRSIMANYLVAKMKRGGEALV